ncbi:MAG: amino acid oxidase, partial [Pseudobutyrivibrio sp.]|nr:amino acid oxidase [Pseudobutyrivibrio sp.]
KHPDTYIIRTEGGDVFESGFVLNATYAGTNQILEMAGFEKFGIKYELCEIILCETNEKLRDVGFTVMDGPFFSIMPFGKTGYHSLTSVTFTPHTTSYDGVPTFACQADSQGHCSTARLGNCNDCPAKPATAFPYMANLARKYMLNDYQFEYKSSLFSMKPILMSSEIDDSRPTVIRKYSDKPTFVGVLSGKINTVYDLDEVLDDVE